MQAWTLTAGFVLLGARGCSSREKVFWPSRCIFAANPASQGLRRLSPGVLPSFSSHCVPNSKPHARSLLRLHGDLAALPTDHVAAGSWSPPIPARGTGVAVPRAKGRRTLEPNPENRWDPGERDCRGVRPRGGWSDTSYASCCLPNTHALAEHSPRAQHCHICSPAKPLRLALSSPLANLRSQLV